MSRFTYGLIALLAVASLASAAPAPDVLEKKPGKESRAQQLRKLMSEMRFDLDKGVDSNTPLKDALEFYSDRWEVPILIDTKAFEAIGIQKVEECPVCLPKMLRVSLGSILRKTMVQIHSDEGVGIFVVRGDAIEVTTTRHINPLCWAENRALAPLVERDFDRIALDEALRDLVDQTGVSVVIDGRVADKARKAVTANLANVPLDTAVQVLADMADLQSVPMENMIYVTSKDNASAILNKRNGFAFEFNPFNMKPLPPDGTTTPNREKKKEKE
jgi:hypothetical protein